MALVSALAWGKEFRRIYLSASWLNQDSTMFNHDASVGVKCSLNLGCLANHLLTPGVEWVRRLSRTMWTSSSLGTFSSISRRKMGTPDGGASCGDA